MAIWERLTKLAPLNLSRKWPTSPTYADIDSPNLRDEEAFKDDSDHETEATTSLPANTRQQFDNLPNKTKWRINHCISLVALFLTVIAILALIAGISSRNHAHAHPSQPPQNPYTYKTHVTTPSKTNSKPHPCGTSAAQARAQNCTFNQLTWAWVPSSCPPYASAAFMAAEPEPWSYWADLQRTTRIAGAAWEEVLDGERAVFGEKREHLTHCVYLALSLAQLVNTGGAYWERLVDLEHHEHCARMLLKELRRGSEGVGGKKVGRRDGNEGGVEEWGDGRWDGLQTFVGGANFDQDCEGRMVHVTGGLG